MFGVYQLESDSYLKQHSKKKDDQWGEVKYYYKTILMLMQIFTFTFLCVYKY